MVESTFFRIVLTAIAWIALTASVRAADATFVSIPVPSAGPKVSQAVDMRAYRIDGARHVYASYPHRIYRGKLPPLMHAIVVVETVLDETGQVKEINVLRAPSHAPDVTAAVREMILRVTPFPTPARLGAVTWTETWLVDRSGRFQLDALTEGQRGE
jgi:protein TonB